MINKYKVEFKVKQHTSIIHFQPDQQGATLRATELKPKLDKFLIAKNHQLPKTEKNSLDYKVNIILTKKVKPSEIGDKYPLYFGNRDDDNTKKFSYTDGLIDIIFTSFDTNILKSIANGFSDFLMKTNFGTRQSKGFGSFSVDEKDVNYKKVKGCITYFSVESCDEIDVFKDISLFYSTIRGGLNYSYKKPEFYFKSMMYFYAKSKGFQWDKKSIKESLISPSEIDKTVERRQLKELLGLSISEEWKNQRVTITRKSKDIDRFKSPITFKPIKDKNGFKVYIYADDIPKEYLDKEFTIKGNKKSFKLKTPEEFDAKEYLKFCVNHDLKKNVENNRDSSDYKKIEKIYKDLKENWR